MNLTFNEFEYAIINDNYYQNSKAGSVKEINEFSYKFYNSLMDKTENFILMSNTGDELKFYPDENLIKREGIENAYCKYFAHFVTVNSFKPDGSYHRIIDFSKIKRQDDMFDSISNCDEKFDCNENDIIKIIFVKNLERNITLLFLRK